MTFSACETYEATVGTGTGTGTGTAATVSPEPQNSDYESGLIDIDGEAWHIRTGWNT